MEENSNSLPENDRNQTLYSIILLDFKQTNDQNVVKIQRINLFGFSTTE